MTIHVETIFLEDHKEQIKIWSDFKIKYDLGEAQDVPNTCNSFKRHLEVHFKQEELLYSQYRETAGDLFNLISLVREQHNSMISLLDGMIDGDYDVNEAKEKFIKFERILFAHILLEENQLYPEFDRVLDEKVKSQIIEDLKTETNK